MFFKDEYSWLSNFHRFPHPITIDGLEWSNSETYYLSCKTNDKELIKWASRNKPEVVKKASKLWKLKPEWNNEYRLLIMKKIIDIKFNIPFYRDKLLALKEEIVEDNYHNDTFFGICKGVGENHLGKIIEAKREDLLRRHRSHFKLLYKGDIYKDDLNYDYVCFTANSVIKEDGKLVMGAGNAKVIRDKYKDIDAFFGKQIYHLSNFGICVNKKERVIAVQSKMHFKDKSQLDVIENSLNMLSAFAKANPSDTIALPYPGIGLGGLSMVELQPLIRKLPSNIHVYTMKNKTYTGIGSRDVPEDISELMTKIATYLETKDYHLRSGGANGSDKAFEVGVTNKENKSIFLPWNLFNGSTSHLVVKNPLADKLAEECHPAYAYLSRAVRKLMARNGCQVLGYELNNVSDFLICYTIDGSRVRTRKTGGTGQALTIAKKFDVKVYNLGNEEDKSYWEKEISK